MQIIIIQLITTIFNIFDLKTKIIVPTARDSINPVPNAVRCGVWEASLHHACRRHATDIQLVAYLRHAHAHHAAAHPAQQAVRGYQNIVPPARQL